MLSLADTYMTYSSFGLGRPPTNQGGRDPKGYDKGCSRIDENTRRELRRKQLCFTCKEPWNPSHKCMG
jgi:hypothetical protein